jgi:myo-inositol 2-dehydrogenase/D-chiro-inositol 1-dehydrogenase
MFQKPLNRRRFLQSTALGSVTFPYIVSSSSLGLAGNVAASNRITMGCIGLGIQGTGNSREFLRQKDVQVVSVCDVRDSQQKKAKDIVDRHYGNTDCKTLNAVNQCS